jgi:hypothetical protein
MQILELPEALPKIFPVLFGVVPGSAGMVHPSQALHIVATGGLEFLTGTHHHAAGQELKCRHQGSQSLSQTHHRKNPFFRHPYGLVKTLRMDAITLDALAKTQRMATPSPLKFHDFWLHFILVQKSRSVSVLSPVKFYLF